MSGPEGRQGSCATEAPAVSERDDEVAMVGPVRLGLGRMGRFHAANLAGRVPGARLVRVADADEDLARENALRLGDASWSTRYDDLLEDPDVEAVVVASPTPPHAQMVEGGARAGKHGFCEKP